MGYNLYIGEAVIAFDNKSDWPDVDIDVRPERHDNAPAFGEDLSDYVNSRHPSYSTWADFCREVGLMKLFFGNEHRDAYRSGEDNYEDNCPPLIQRHPGVVPLTETHRKYINAAYEKRKAENERDGKVPGFQEDWDPEGFGLKKLPGWENKDPSMVRLTWLHYWVNWALDNCKHPVFKNT